MQKVKLKVKLKLMCGHALLLHHLPAPEFLYQVNQLHTEIILKVPLER